MTKHGDMRRWLAPGLWLAAMILLAGQGMWSVRQHADEAEARLLSEAGRTAARVAAILAAPGQRPDGAAARAAVEACMEDERIYGIAIRAGDRGAILSGQRRNYQWEALPWDGEFMESTVQGVSGIRSGPGILGSVEVHLSRRITDEEVAGILRVELARFAVNALACTVLLLWILWRRGDLARLGRLAGDMWGGGEADGADGAGEARPIPEPSASGASASEPPAPSDDGPVVLRPEEPERAADVDADAGRRHMAAHPESLGVTMGLFRRTFERAPALVARLHAREAAPELAHLGHLLERAAPCIGAERLREAAAGMRRAMNDPRSDERSLAAEACIAALQDVLKALER